MHHTDAVQSPERHAEAPPTMPSPTCSIVIPVYNDPGHLADALASVRRQTRATWEAIVVDDGSSSDSAATLVQSLGDDRVRLIRHASNRGLAAARNTGIRAARTDIIVPLDADDMLEPGYLERIVPFLGPGSRYNCAFSDYLGFGGFNGVIRQGALRHQGVVEYSQDELVSLLRHQWIPAGGAAFRKELWELVGGYCEDPALLPGNEDFDFWVGALEVGLVPVYVAEPLYRYRVAHGSMMTRLRPVLWATHLFIYDRHRAIYDRHDAGRAFLADGFIRSGEATRTLGRRRAAITLAVRGLLLQPRRWDGFGVIGRALLPTRMLDVLRGLRHRWAAQP
jgi:glycosyltransferase involved in cell wall biosynthesis